MYRTGNTFILPRFPDLSHIYANLSALLLLLCPIFCHALIQDLEKDMSSEFVLESKKIDIPGYPLAFNASIIRWKGSLLMSFRYIPNPQQNFTSWIGLVWLDNNFTPVGIPQILNNRPWGNPIPSRAEDARLITIGSKLYLVYSDCSEPKISRSGFRVYIAELKYDGQNFTLLNPECLSQFEGENKDRREKNWVPFDYKGTLYLAYSLTPHKIVKPMRGSGKCISLHTSKSSLSWEWGVLRGGTPGIIDGKEYLAFFHSSIDLPTIHSDGKVVAHYFMGAYTFSQNPPFAITRISPKPIVGKGYYSGATYKPYWKPVKVVFPCGFIADEKFIWVTYGRDDHEIWVTKLDKKGLYKSLVSVKTVDSLDSETEI